MNEYVKETLACIMLSLTGSASSNRLVAMIGAYNLRFHNPNNGNIECIFNFKMCKKYNLCNITYQCGRDEYSMRFMKFKKSDSSITNEDLIEGLYFSDLRSKFETETGLALGLRSIK